MLRIGVFSKLSRVSIRMLRHYDDIGLLKPAEIDQFTGYRYYSPEQLPVIGRITALKDMGFSLADIVKMLEIYENRDELDDYLMKRQLELQEISETTQRQMRLLDTARERLIGQNVFVRTVINADDGRDIDVLTMGPICITPELKRNGYGKMLLDFSLEKAAEMGFGAVLFEGNIDFYGKSGFDYARKFGIRYHDLPEGADDSFFLCKELIPGYLDEVIGVYQTPQAYYVDDADVEEFDKNFPAKEKLKLPDQIFG